MGTNLELRSFFIKTGNSEHMAGLANQREVHIPYVCMALRLHRKGNPVLMVQSKEWSQVSGPTMGPALTSGS